jgi:hypothetical protein
MPSLLNKRTWPKKNLNKNFLAKRKKKKENQNYLELAPTLVNRLLYQVYAGVTLTGSPSGMMNLSHNW